MHDGSKPVGEVIDKNTLASLGYRWNGGCSVALGDMFCPGLSGGFKLILAHPPRSFSSLSGQVGRTSINACSDGCTVDALLVHPNVGALSQQTASSATWTSASPPGAWITRKHERGRARASQYRESTKRNEVRLPFQHKFVRRHYRPELSNEASVDGQENQRAENKLDWAGHSEVVKLGSRYGFSTTTARTCNRNWRIAALASHRPQFVDLGIEHAQICACIHFTEAWLYDIIQMFRPLGDGSRAHVSEHAESDFH
ncbi:hypothetical protein [Methylobacterium sp. CM6244]